MKGNLSPWNVSADKFPTKARIENQIKFLLRYAILAPSGHNSQPWKFRLKDSVVEILPDFSRKREKVDPEGREIYIALGCAAANIELAGKSLGLRARISLENDRVRMEFERGEKEGGGNMLKAITKRVTTRSPFENRTIEKEILNKIIEAGKEEGVRLTLIEAPEKKKEVAEMVRESIKLWYRNRALISELQRWVVDKDGLPIEALNLEGISEDLSYFWKDDEEKAEHKADREKELLEEAPGLMIFSSQETKPGWIETGWAFERAAIMATVYGLNCGFSTAITEIKEKRAELKTYLGIKEEPQLLIRIGYNNEKSHTPRRNLKEVLMN